MLALLAQIDAQSTIDSANQLLQANDVNKLLLAMVIVLIVSATLLGITFLRRNTDNGSQGTIIELASVISEQNRGLHELADSIREQTMERKEADRQIVEVHKAVGTKVNTIENDVTSLKNTVLDLESKIDELKAVISEPQPIAPDMQARLNELATDIRTILDIIRRDTNEMQAVRP